MPSGSPRFRATSGVPIVFKSSFDKANRTSQSSFRGPGLQEGLRVLERVKRETDSPVLTDIHEPAQAAAGGRGRRRVADSGAAFAPDRPDCGGGADRRGGQPEEGAIPRAVGHAAVVAKAESFGNRRFIVTERGFSFGYNNLVSDFRALVIMRAFGYPVVFDATHSAQLPGAGGERFGRPARVRRAAGARGGGGRRRRAFHGSARRPRPRAQRRSQFVSARFAAGAARRHHSNRRRSSRGGKPRLTNCGASKRSPSPRVLGSAWMALADNLATGAVFLSFFAAHWIAQAMAWANAHARRLVSAVRPARHAAGPSGRIAHGRLFFAALGAEQLDLGRGADRVGRPFQIAARARAACRLRLIYTLNPR